MTYDTPTISPAVTLGHPRDSRASRVPTPTPTPTKDRTAARRAGSLGRAREGARAAAARLHEEPGASRRPPGVFSDAEFRRLCALVRSELATHAGLGGADLMEHLKCATARARLRYDSAVLGRVLAVVRPRSRVLARYREAVGMHWRDRCAHAPTCATPTQCALRAAREGR